jgi:hypothetical protein
MHRRRVILGSGRSAFPWLALIFGLGRTPKPDVNMGAKMNQCESKRTCKQVDPRSQSVASAWHFSSPCSSPRGASMPRFFGLATRKAAAMLAAVATSGPVLAADVELLPNGLMTPTTKEQTKPNQFEKAPPWRIGVSFGGVGNTLDRADDPGDEIHRVAGQERRRVHLRRGQLAGGQAGGRCRGPADEEGRRHHHRPDLRRHRRATGREGGQGRHPGGGVRCLRQGHAIECRDGRRR